MILALVMPLDIIEDGWILEFNPAEQIGGLTVGKIEIAVLGGVTPLLTCGAWEKRVRRLEKTCGGWEKRVRGLSKQM